jgi:hypothetical protein
MNPKLRIQNIDGVTKEFDKKEDAIEFIQNLFIENEDWSEMKNPNTYAECVNYLVKFCDNWILI